VPAQASITTFRRLRRHAACAAHRECRMRLLVVLMSIAMSVIAWLSQRGAFRPTQGTVSDAYPTLLVVAGYAFSI
jgi:hypothetical protein